MMTILEALVHRQVGCDDDEMLRQIGARLSKPMKIAPDNGQAHHLGLAAASRHLAAVPGPAVLFRVDPEGQIRNGVAAELEH
jgi:hypothetical protein